MTSSVSVVIPVKDGERYLPELLAALANQAQEIEVLVVDSGSQDQSVEIARSAGARVIEIDSSEFGHGRTRNFAAEQTSGELICFLTQDATPTGEWLAGYLEIFATDERIGAAFGPHLPRTDTSPMIARELEDFFNQFSPNGQPTVQAAGDEPFLSNVNACYRRSCWEEIRFRDLSYSEDQAFGRDMLSRGWLKAYQPRAAVLHAHDYGPLEFMRRYFDEYRGLRESSGHVEPINPRNWVGDTRKLTAADRAWMKEHGFSNGKRAYWTGRSIVHHSGRKVFSALGSHSGRLPNWLQSRLSLEAREDRDVTDDLLGTTVVPPAVTKEPYDEVIELLQNGPASLLKPRAESRQFNALFVLPESHPSELRQTVEQLQIGLSEQGHTAQAVHPEQLAQAIGSDTDFLIATDFSSLLATETFGGAFQRGCLLTDYEPPLYPESSQRIFSEFAYRQNDRFIVTNPWTQQKLATAGYKSDLIAPGIDHTVFKLREVQRNEQKVVCYTPTGLPKYAATLAVFALEELNQLQPDLEIFLFGEGELPRFSFTYTHLGKQPAPDLLADHCTTASLGISLSLSAPATPLREMLACGLPVIDLDHAGSAVEFSDCEAVTLAPPNPLAIAEAASGILRVKGLHGSLAAAANTRAQQYRWERTAEQIDSIFKRWSKESGGAAQ